MSNVYSIIVILTNIVRSNINDILQTDWFGFVFGTVECFNPFYLVSNICQYFKPFDVYREIEHVDFVSGSSKVCLFFVLL